VHGVSARHLRLLVAEFVEHYHVEHSPQGLANELVVPRVSTANDNGRVKRHKRLGGMLSFYHSSRCVMFAPDHRNRKTQPAMR
jgi:hypothetical protein